MKVPNGVCKLQKPASKFYSFVSIPKQVEELLQMEKGDDVCIFGIPVGDEDDNETIFCGFILDKTKDYTLQMKRVLSLLG